MGTYPGKPTESVLGGLSFTQVTKQCTLILRPALDNHLGELHQLKTHVKESIVGSNVHHRVKDAKCLAKQTNSFGLSYKMPIHVSVENYLNVILNPLILHFQI